MIDIEILKELNITMYQSCWINDVGGDEVMEEVELELVWQD